MEVTRRNFEEAFEVFKVKLIEADFVSIDGEFTGLSTLKTPRFTFDTLEEKYTKAKLGSEKFLMIQIGICLFTWKKESNCYEVFPFTFYVFPRPYKRHLNDVFFMCQSSSLDFLASHNFDFNKFIYDGISYVHPTAAEKAKEHLEKSLKLVDDKNKTSSGVQEINHETLKPKLETSVFIPKNQRDFIEEILKSVATFLQDPSQKECDLPPCNPFQRKLIYEVVGEKYPMGIYLKSETSENQKFVRVIKVTNKTCTIKNLEERERELKIFSEAVGFVNLMKLLSEQKKPIIGHNMFLDLFYIITNFFCEAPDELKEFKSLITELFPSVYDTKLIASTNPLLSKVTNTGLRYLTESIGSGLPSINIEFDKEIPGENIQLDVFHDAGFDALCTGKCFISLVNCLAHHLDHPAGCIDFSVNYIQPFKNRIFMMGIQDITYMDLTKEDKQPNREGIFLVSFPQKWTETELHNLFLPICKISHPIVWKDSTSAYVILSDKTKHTEVVKNIVNQKHLNFTVTPLKEIFSEVPEEMAKETSKRSYSDVEDGEISSDDSSEPSTKKQMFDVSPDW